LDAVRVPSEQGFPFRLDRLVVFLMWRGGHDRSKVRIDISNARTGIVVRRFEGPVEFRSRTTAMFGVYRFNGCVFPEPGYYCVEAFCNEEFVDDQRIEVIAP
jgi:hypothetical protein